MQLRSQFHSLQVDSGKKQIHQSHKTILTLKSLQMFNRMAKSKDILNLQESCKGTVQERVDDGYLCGVKKLIDRISGKDPTLRKFRLHFAKINHEGEDLGENGNIESDHLDI